VQRREQVVIVSLRAFKPVNCQERAFPLFSWLKLLMKRACRPKGGLESSGGILPTIGFLVQPSERFRAPFQASRNERLADDHDSITSMSTETRQKQDDDYLI